MSDAKTALALVQELRAWLQGQLNSTRREIEALEAKTWGVPMSQNPPLLIRQGSELGYTHVMSRLIELEEELKKDHKT